MNYTDGVTSAIQTQLDAKVPTTRTINGSALSSNVTLDIDDVAPTQTGNSGKVLKTDGTNVTWQSESGSSLPDQTGNSGKYLTTDGTDASWASLGGGGDMAAATYDPNGVAGDAFDMDNMAQGSTNKFVTATDITNLSNLSGTNTGDQDLSGYVPTTRTVAGNALSSNVTQDNITGLSSTGIVKRTGSNTLATATAGTDYYNPGGTDVAVTDGGTGASNASGARTNLGLAIGTDVQAHDSDLDTIAGLTATTNNFIQSASSAWASRTPTQVTATLDAMVGDSGSGGTKGLVPAPSSGDASKYLKGDGTWSTPSGGGGSGMTWTTVTSDTTMSVNTGYVVNQVALSTINMTIPATSAVGDTISVLAIGNGPIKLLQASGQSITFSSTNTTTGTSGNILGNSSGIAITIVCTVANTTWMVVSSTGDYIVT